MTCQQVVFAQGNCLVEIEPQLSDPSGPRYVARMSVVEDAGAIVRPLVSRDGRRVKIFASSESTAAREAVAYLASRFGQVSRSEQACGLGAASIGRPFVMAIAPVPEEVTTN